MKIFSGVLAVMLCSAIASPDGVRDLVHESPAETIAGTTGMMVLVMALLP